MKRRKGSPAARTHCVDVERRRGKPERLGERSTSIRRRGPREETFAAPFASAAPKSNAI